MRTRTPAGPQDPGPARRRRTSCLSPRYPPADDRTQAMPDVTVCPLLHTLNVGGAEVLAARLARRLRDRCRFVFICLDELGTLGQELRAEGFPVEVLGRRPGLD